MWDDSTPCQSASSNLDYTKMLIWLPANAPGRHWIIAKVLSFLSSTWDTQMKFLALGFDLAVGEIWRLNQ